MSVLITAGSKLADLPEVFKSAVTSIGESVRWWADEGTAGAFLSEPVLEWVASAESVTVDVTELTFNLSYLAGYAVGKNRPLRTVANSTHYKETPTTRELGLFETFGLKKYQSAAELIALIGEAKLQRPLVVPEQTPNQKAPIYILLPKVKLEMEIHLASRVKKTGFQYRSFDPEEQVRTSVQEIAKNVWTSHGVIVPLVPTDRSGAKPHNLRAAFVAGLTAATEKELLLLQFGDTPVPTQYADLAPRAIDRSQIDGLVADYVPLITERLSASAGSTIAVPRTFLEKLDLGDPAAENEMSKLLDYYLETDEYRRASRGEVKVVAGRKGVGKTALFVNLRGQLRRNPRMIVLDLKPEGYQLLKFKERVLSYLAHGTQEHTITAFWEYLLLLEICHRLIEADKARHLTNHKLTMPYHELVAAYKGDGYIAEGDFAERMMLLTERIMESFQAELGLSKGGASLTSSKITSLLYRHDVRDLKNKVINYIEAERPVWVLFDNLDKGWPPHGVKADDVLILRCLIDAIAKLERHFRKAEKLCHGIIFIRNDVYEHLVENSADREKTSKVSLDWTDPKLLKEILRRRLVANQLPLKTPFHEVWPKACVSHIGAEESAGYLIERCLMRPRALLTLLGHCRSRAVNLGHERIEVEDIEEGEEAYSSGLVATFGLEVHDVYPAARDLPYEFIGSPARVSRTNLNATLLKLAIDPTEHDKLVDLLLWYGFIGVVRDGGDVTYIYDVRYDLKHLKALIRLQSADSPQFCINPAFWSGLEIVT